MRRFKASKYKNAAPKLKKHESWVRDLVVGSYNCSGSFIKASAAFVAFNVQATGSQLGVVPLEAEGVSGTTLPILNCHSDLVTDFEFSPFEDGLLATGSADSTVKVWSVNNSSLDDLSLLNPELVMSSKHRRVETVSFSPTSEYLLSFSAQNAIQFWDILYGKELLHDTSLHGDTIMSMSWSRAGSLLATCAKDKQVRVVDPRANAVTLSAVGHENGKDSRVVWLGDSNFLLTSGFDSSRMRQLFVWDTRSFEKPVKSLSFGSSTGILMPLYDPDTNMIFVAARGDSSISYYEFSESDDFFVEGYRYNGDQTKGACLLPKRALKVMDTEVNRILQLTANSVVPIPFHVPRKSYIDFHQDLYPNTNGTNTTGSASVWMDGFTGTVTKISLNPSVNGGNLKVFKESLSERKAKDEQKISKVIESPADIENYKKSVPEPRPRKKSIGSSGSSSDELVEATPTGKFFPVPKPRVSSNATSSVLRTPSSFISSRMTADFTQRNSVSKDIDSSLQTNVSSTENDHLGDGDKHNGSSDHQVSRNDNESGLYNNNNDHNTQSYTNNESNDNEISQISSERDSGSFNGNETKSSPPQLSTAERRKMLENRDSTPADGSISEGNGGDTFEERKPQMSVAERMKMFQKNSAGGKDSAEEGNGSSHTNNSHSLHSNSHHKICAMSSEDSSSGFDEQTDAQSKENREPCPAPIAKPERKFTPPKQEPVQTTRKQEKIETVAQSKPPTSNKRIDTVFGQVSKYRNYKATPLHKKMHLENLRNISTTCPGESELIQANPERVAVPLNTPGGKVAIFELSKPGRQTDGVIPALVHGSKVMDFMWDPFDNTRLAVGDDSGKLWVWHIPPGGLKEQTNEAEFTIPAHAEKIYFVRFHPLAKDVLATGSYDMTIKIWNLEAQEEIVLVPCYQIQMFCFAWSPCGQRFATASKDGKVRVYDPRESVEPIAVGQGPPGVRGGRVTFVLDGKYLVVAGFDRSSERQLHMYNAADLKKVTTVSLDVSPAILVPFYDEDSSVLFLSGRGDSTIFAYDVIETSPYLFPLSPHRCSGAHQGISFLKKNACEVQNVEFAKAYRLTEVVIEPWSFTVPRVKSEYFQDDLFPPTRVLWEPTMSADDWANGSNVCAKRISLKPEYMRSLGDVTGAHRESTENGMKATNGKANNTSTPATIPLSAQIGTSMVTNGAKKQQEKLEQAIKNKLPLNLQLEQDNMEGVDEEEWDD